LPRTPNGRPKSWRIKLRIWKTRQGADREAAKLKRGPDLLKRADAAKKLCETMREQAAAMKRQAEAIKKQADQLTG
jgi:hypothetical protein